MKTIAKFVEILEKLRIDFDNRQRLFYSRYYNQCIRHLKRKHKVPKTSRKEVNLVKLAQGSGESSYRYMVEYVEELNKLYKAKNYKAVIKEASKIL